MFSDLWEYILWIYCSSSKRIGIYAQSFADLKMALIHTLLRSLISVLHALQKSQNKVP